MPCGFLDWASIHYCCVVSGLAKTRFHEEVVCKGGVLVWASGDCNINEREIAIHMSSDRILGPLLAGSLRRRTSIVPVSFMRQ